MNRPAFRVADLRDAPSYTIVETARYLSVPRTTIAYWVTPQGRQPALIAVADRRPTLLSFFNLAELHVLAAIRRRHTVPMAKVRSAIGWLKRHTSDPADKRHPLISKQLETDGLDLFVQHYGELVNISRDGQIAIRQVLSAALKRIDRDPNGIPIRLYPFTRSKLENAPSLVVIDPRLAAGRPVIAGTGLVTEIIAERYKAGESVRELAADYERGIDEIEEAIRCEFQAAA